MKFTSEERSKIATRMRDAVREGEYLDDAIMRAVYEAIGETKRPVGFIIADLIDPTCKVENDNPWASDFDYVCRACGEHFSTCDKPNYCPGCGCRCVNDGEASGDATD